VEVKAFLAALARRGHKDARVVKASAGALAGGGAQVEVPSLKAKVVLNIQPSSEAEPLESTIETPSRDARRLLSAVLEELLPSQ